LITVAVGLGAILLAWLATDWQPILIGMLASIVTAILQVGGGIRDLVTGITRDLVETEKARLEIEKLRHDLAEFDSRLKGATPDETARFAPSEVMNTTVPVREKSWGS
jgi:cell shape-determining protein MreC